MAFTISPTFKRWPEPVAIVLDMIEDVKHMFLGGSDPLCTVDNNDHSALGHLADLGIDALRLFPYATLLAVAIAFFAYLPAIAGGVTSIANVSNPVAPINGAPANNVVPSNPSVIPSPTPTLVPTSTQVPTATDIPTQAPLTSTPTLTPTATAIAFAKIDECDLLSAYPGNYPNKAVRSESILVSLIPYLNKYGYYGDPQDQLYLGSVDKERVAITLGYKANLHSPFIALPPEFWGTLPTNHFCQIDGKWNLLPKMEGELPINN